MWDHREDATPSARRAVCGGIVSFVSDCGARFDVWPDIKRGLELGRVADFACCQVGSERQALEIGLDVDFCRKPAARASKRLILLPPFAPAADTWARTTVLSNICIR